MTWDALFLEGWLPFSYYFDSSNDKIFLSMNTYNDQEMQQINTNKAWDS